MVKHTKAAKVTLAKTLGVGLMAGGLLLGAPVGMASADHGDPVGDFVGFAVNGVNGNVQNLVNQQNSGLQGIVRINNVGLQSAVSNGQATFNNAHNFVRFAVQGILTPSGGA